MRPPDAPDYRLGIVGAGALGQGIAQVAVTAGLDVSIVDSRPGLAETACRTVAGRFEALVERGRMTVVEQAAALARLVPVARLASLATSDAVIETLVEDRAVKRTVIAELEEIVAAGCLIASATASVPVAALAAGAQRPARIAGMHFLAPVPVMRLVEIVRAVATDAETVSALEVLARRLGREPVVVRDAPGFLVGLGGAALVTEALRLQHDGVAAAPVIDAIMRDAWGFSSGPFEMMDEGGLDRACLAVERVWAAHQHDPRLAPRPGLRALMEGGRLGRVTGRGWYAWEDGGPSAVADPALRPPGPAARAVAVMPGASEGLIGLCAVAGVAVTADDGACPVLAAPQAMDASDTAYHGASTPAARRGLARRLVAVDLGPTADGRVTLMTAPGADPACRDAVAAALSGAGREVSAIADSVGFVGPRIAAMVVNLGCWMAETGLAAPGEYDRAMVLGLGYPSGPLALVEAMVPTRVLMLLEA
ncbi:MAG: 3-hydroxyacyl-CoA dehydrogenase NAD-binding domain-containing protein, partial [Pseudomonadota bacterium]